MSISYEENNYSGKVKREIRKISKKKIVFPGCLRTISRNIEKEADLEGAIEVACSIIGR